MSEKTLRVLFLSRDDQALSQMAAALLRRIGGDRFVVSSAATDAPAATIHPLVNRVLAERGIEVSDAPQSMAELRGQRFDLLITTDAEPSATILATDGRQVFWKMSDPDQVAGAEDAQLRAFRSAMNELETRVRRLVNADLDREALYAAGEPLRVLILCTANSARSQIAEAWFRVLGRGAAEVVSAGIKPAAQVHPMAVQVMAERGINISAQRPKAVADLVGYYDYVFTVCEAARDECPSFPSTTARLHWSYPDPAVVTDPAERLTAFRTVRDGLEQQVRGFVERWLTQHRPDLLQKTAV